MQETFHTDFSYAMLRTMLSSEFYIGKYRNNLNYCPAYLTAAEWKEIQKISSRNVHTKPFGARLSVLLRSYPLPSMRPKALWNRMQFHYQPPHRRKKRTYCYYRCNRALVDHICTYRHRMSQNLIEEYLLKNLEREYELLKSEYPLYPKSRNRKNKRTPKTNKC